jgi:hypothetical protein
MIVLGCRPPIWIGGERAGRAKENNLLLQTRRLPSKQYRVKVWYALGNVRRCCRTSTVKSVLSTSMRLRKMKEERGENGQ